MSFRPHAARCRGCGAPSAAPRFAPTVARCLACGREAEVELPTHGGVREVELGIAALFKQQAWLDALRRRDAEGLVIADRCTCDGPLVVPASASLGASCDHCGLAQEWTVGEHVVDALPASTVRGSTWGGGLTLRFEPSLVEASVDAPSPCPGCGAELPAFRGQHRCAHCKRTLHAMLSCGHRFLVGFYVEGDDEGRPVSGWLPIAEAVEGYAARRELASRSRWSTLRGMGLWVLLIFAFPLCACPVFVASGTIVALLPPELQRFGPAVLMGAFALLALLAMGAFAWLLVSRIRRHNRDREALLGKLSPLPAQGTRPDHA